MSLLEPDVILSPPIVCSGKGCQVVPPNPDPTGLVGPWLGEGWTCLVHKGPDENSFSMRWLCPSCSQRAKKAEAQMVGVATALGMSPETDAASLILRVHELDTGWAELHAKDQARVGELEGEVSKEQEDAEGYRVNAESDVRNLRDLLRRSFVNGCKMDYLQDDSIAVEVHEALGVSAEAMPLSALARQISEKDGGKA